MTLNKVLLGRQPKLFDIFSFRRVVRVFLAFFGMFLSILVIKIFFCCLFLGPKKAMAAES